MFNVLLCLLLDLFQDNYSKQRPYLKMFEWNSLHVVGHAFVQLPAERNG